VTASALVGANCTLSVAGAFPVDVSVTVCVAGTTTAELLLDRLTLCPPLAAAAFIRGKNDEIRRMRATAHKRSRAL